MQVIGEVGGGGVVTGGVRWNGNRGMVGSGCE